MMRFYNNRAVLAIFGPVMCQHLSLKYADYQEVTLPSQM